MDVEELRGGDAGENAEMLRRLLEGEKGARREAVLWNAAVALTVEGRARDVADGYEMASAAIDEGRAGERFARMCAESRTASGAASPGAGTPA